MLSICNTVDYISRWKAWRGSCTCLCHCCSDCQDFLIHQSDHLLFLVLGIYRERQENSWNPPWTAIRCVVTCLYPVVVLFWLPNILWTYYKAAMFNYRCLNNLKRRGEEVMLSHQPGLNSVLVQTLQNSICLLDSFTIFLDRFALLNRTFSAIVHKIRHIRIRISKAFMEARKGFWPPGEWIPRYARANSKREKWAKPRTMASVCEFVVFRRKTGKFTFEEQAGGSLSGTKLVEN